MGKSIFVFKLSIYIIIKIIYRKVNFIFKYKTLNMNSVLAHLV